MTPFVRLLCLSPAVLVLSAHVQAAPLEFSATYTGQSQIVEVLSAAGPVVRVQSNASGDGTLGLEEYFSEDVIDLGTGAGSGRSVFRTADGDELFAVFDVQLLPTDAPGVLDILGLVEFDGGSGRFRRARGQAELLGRGAFIDADTANSSFEFRGTLLAVAEPGSLLMMMFGLLGCLVRPARSSTRGACWPATSC